MARNYFQTHSGIINIVLLILNFICFICILASWLTGATLAFLVATIFGIIITGLFSLIHFFSINEKLRLPWLYMEMVYALIWAVYYLIVAVIVITFSGAAHTAAGIFGILTVMVYLTKGLHTRNMLGVSEPAIQVQS